MWDVSLEFVLHWCPSGPLTLPPSIEKCSDRATPSVFATLDALSIGVGANSCGIHAVCHELGIDSSQNSFGYIAHWAGDGKSARSKLVCEKQKASLSRIRVHDLRHTAASQLLAEGIHPRVVQEMLGHSTISLTLGTYSHVLPTLHKDAADRVDALFSKPRSEPELE